MRLQLDYPPEDVTRLVIDTLAEMLRGEQFRPNSALGTTPPERLSLTVPHKVYSMTLQDAAEHHSPWDARCTRWRFLVDDQERAHTIAAVDVAVKPDSTDIELSGISEGPFVHATATAIHDVEKSLGVPDDSGDGAYRIRALELPALNVIALWLGEIDGEHHYFRPLGRSLPELERGLLYPWTALAGLLAEGAQRRLAQGRPGTLVEP